MILPERVLGSPGAQWMASGAAKAPMCFLTSPTRSFLRESAGGGRGAAVAWGRVSGRD
jgi:hypothetical protein